ncbi:hypothetical protein H5410_022934 [Solanum commersonii]|uniref:Uncharacterized protein n=1 Tax=Solanum commersonii TaxID=4109 RepID=A0A9J5ZGU7_SOLCO|nr:hypothetical protein H5410_022934 [Solanum commersonii]
MITVFVNTKKWDIYSSSFHLSVLCCYVKVFLLLLCIIYALLVKLLLCFNLINSLKSLPPAGVTKLFSQKQSLGMRVQIVALRMESLVTFPNDISRLRNLKYFNLRGCDFSGSIPDSIGNLTQMRQLDFGDNHFTGHTPSIISKLKQLTLIDLWSNSLGGEISHIFSNFQMLAELVLSNNRLTGSFPPSILSLTSSKIRLYEHAHRNLSNNSLNGTIPSWVFSIPLVYPLKLHHNQFSGVANELKMNPTLNDLDLSHNQLSGPVPPSLANLINLAALDLSSNNIIDDLGIEFFLTMQRIDYIDLSYNHLSWRKVLLFSSCELKDFAHFLRGIKTIRVLDLSNNEIHGSIPNWFSNMRWDSLSHLNISHNSLTGHLKQLHFYNLKSLDLNYPSHAPQPLESEEEDDESYFASGFTWELVVIGYGCGLVVGTVMCNIMFKDGKPKWFLEGIIPHKNRR